MVRGVVEGFYGRPYEGGRRRVLLRTLASLSEPAFMYAPKNDPFHRLHWREDYPSESWRNLTRDMHEAREFGVDFIFGISPWGFHDGDAPILKKKVRRALDAGAAGTALLFDDIPENADAELARRQLAIASEALGGLGCPVYLCPSMYCDELLERNRGHDYLDCWREEVNGDWKSLWTGSQVISRELDPPSLDQAAGLLGDVPAVWDNLLADDYCHRRIYLAGLENRIPAGCDYFLNPPECFPAALFGTLSLVKAAGSSWEWPPELGRMPEAWDLIAGFHHTPWSSSGKASRIIAGLAGTLDGDLGELVSMVGEAREMTGRFLDDLETVPWGWEIAPYARDLWRILGWWKEVLALPGRSRMVSRLHHLMFRRLPYDHPLALITSEFAAIDQEGDL